MNRTVGRRLFDGGVGERGFASGTRCPNVTVVGIGDAVVDIDCFNVSIIAC